jgi:hypothetical protein
LQVDGTFDAGYSIDQLSRLHLQVGADTYGNTATFQADIGQTKQALETSGEFFIDFFIHEELTTPVPPFHLKCWLLMTTSSIARAAIAIPRGHAKTTLAKLAVVWNFLFTKTRFCVYLSNTNTIAVNACTDIIAYMTNNENFIKIYGEIEFETKRAGDGFYKFMLNGKKCILRAMGAGQQVRGLNVDNQRPDLAIIDDLEDIENTATKQLLKQLSSWLYRTFFKAMARRNRIVWIGNIISYECILHKLVTSSDVWNSMLYGCILSNGEPLWPEQWSFEELLEDFKEYRSQGETASWYAEMMNMPIPEGAGLLQSDDIIYKPRRSPVDLLSGFITIDPAISKQSAADNTGIAVHGIIDEMPEIVDYKLGKFDPMQTINIALALCEEWNLNVIGIESNAYQASLEFWFQVEFQRRGITNITIVQLYNSNRKTERLMVWSSMMKAGYYGVPEWDILITQQLLKYDATKKENDDDLIDACSQGVQMLQFHLDVIMQQYALNVIETTQRELQVCGV